MLSETHIILVVLLVALIFGARKLPEIGAGLGKGIKNFKNSIKDTKEEEPEKLEDKENTK
ncbi:MAG: twin-arginine translocase TatA/TatE family subunit [Desulfurella sp.]|jgi:sec-independent protein translocase protein TatA|uniref:Sec-independent protein translocase protein TatA n=1 Tax=Desulfurella multipotens TaxID=79269 RepID=A0A1G6MLV3_9BACT|nr:MULTISPECIES: twin-arginine translocase TatA/TatE family subunit [Desulfurella]PMP64349.1 MAG: twin-arginine translocase TatA/TatE family subunit [Desulfurella multipotens]PMP91649.1 MAG: twin-arginine translocase TatA/TatE family subunit [Desulfurella sp.]SDC56451.1 sec-independent protein translocase protein TatA [Desulfurella multipotens]HEX14111.1 twin-arginine translocase TatA/TatE family subunit [Desulfurella acetivorans]